MQEMFDSSDPRHELWDTEDEDEDDEEEEEEEEEEEGDSDSSSDGSEDSHTEETQEFGERGQDPASCFQPKARHPGSQHCRRRLFAPYALQERHSPGLRSSCRVELKPWGRETPPWETPLSHWVQDTRAVCVTNWGTQQVSRFRSRTLSHPSFQSFYTAVSTCSRSSPAAATEQGVLPLELEPRATPLPAVDCSGFFYTDPTMPPGHRIYNCLSVSTQEVLRSLSLETPPPIMSVRPASPPRRAGARTQWLSELECKAVSALMELPDSTSQDGCQPSPCLPGEMEGLREMETSDVLP